MVLACPPLPPAPQTAGRLGSCVVKRGARWAPLWESHGAPIRSDRRGLARGPRLGAERERTHNVTETRLACSPVSRSATRFTSVSVARRASRGNFSLEAQQRLTGRTAVCRRGWPISSQSPARGSRAGRETRHGHPRHVGGSFIFGLGSHLERG